MRTELRYFTIGDSYGGNQDWMADHWMNIGGFAALTACDSMIYFSLVRKQKDVCPFDPQTITREEYMDFGMQMKPYIRPRFAGVYKLNMYISGLKDYLKNRGMDQAITMEELRGIRPYEEAREAVVRQIIRGFVVPCLTLNHQDPEFDDYVWHWFILNGFDETDDGRLMVKAATYGEYRWLDFKKLWDTGYERRGGLVLYGQR